MKYLILILFFFTVSQDTIKQDTIQHTIQQNEMKDDLDSISIHIKMMIQQLKSDTI